MSPKTIPIIIPLFYLHYEHCLATQNMWRMWSWPTHLSSPTAQKSPICWWNIPKWMVKHDNIHIIYICHYIYIYTYKYMQLCIYIIEFYIYIIIQYYTIIYIYYYTYNYIYPIKSPHSHVRHIHVRHRMLCTSHFYQDISGVSKSSPFTK